MDFPTYRYQVYMTSKDKKCKLAFIWDLDGTWIEAILAGIEKPIISFSSLIIRDFLSLIFCPFIEQNCKEQIG